MVRPRGNLTCADQRESHCLTKATLQNSRTAASNECHAPCLRVNSLLTPANAATNTNTPPAQQYAAKAEEIHEHC